MRQKKQRKLDKLEEKLERLRDEQQKINKIAEKSNKTLQEPSEQDISRRKFLKKLATGLSIGALSLSPVASQLKLGSSEIFTSGTKVSSGFQQALSEGKALADNGNTYESVQKAVDNASDYVKVGPGTFSESLTVSTRGLMIEGVGNNSVIDGNSSGPGIKITADNVTVKNLASKSSASEAVLFDGNKNSKVENIRVKGSASTAIEMGPSNGKNKSTNCIVESSQSVGIRSDYRCIVSNCITQNTSKEGIYCNSSGSIVENNIIKDAGDDAGIYGSGGSENSVVGGNRIINPTNYGIDWHGTDSIIFNNRCSGGSIVVHKSSSQKEGNI